MSRQSTSSNAATIGIDIGKNTFHLIGLDQRGNIVLQLKTSREQLERRLANIPRCLIGMEACSPRPSYRSAARSPWSRRTPHPSAVCEAVPQRTQERLSRCRSNRRSRAAADHELRQHQDA